MPTVFADAGFWIASINPLDKWAEAALAAAWAVRHRQFVTTEFVIAETLNSFSGRGRYWRTRSARFLFDNVIFSARVTVLRPTDVQVVRAMELFLDRPDKAWGLTDCISFSLMRELRIDEALAYDHHFEQAGFRALLRDE